MIRFAFFILLTILFQTQTSDQPEKQSSGNGQQSPSGPASPNSPEISQKPGAAPPPLPAVSTTSSAGATSDPNAVSGATSQPTPNAMATAPPAVAGFPQALTLADLPWQEFGQTASQKQEEYSLKKASIERHVSELARVQALLIKLLDRFEQHREEIQLRSRSIVFSEPSAENQITVTRKLLLSMLFNPEWKAFRAEIKMLLDHAKESLALSEEYQPSPGESPSEHAGRLQRLLTDLHSQKAQVRLRLVTRQGQCEDIAQTLHRLQELYRQMLTERGLPPQQFEIKQAIVKEFRQWLGFLHAIREQGKLIDEALHEQALAVLGKINQYAKEFTSQIAEFETLLREFEAKREESSRGMFFNDIGRLKSTQYFQDLLSKVKNYFERCEALQELSMRLNSLLSDKKEITEDNIRILSIVENPQKAKIDPEEVRKTKAHLTEQLDLKSAEFERKRRLSCDVFLALVQEMAELELRGVELKFLANLIAEMSSMCPEQAQILASIISAEAAEKWKQEDAEWNLEIVPSVKHKFDQDMALIRRSLPAAMPREPSSLNEVCRASQNILGKYGLLVEFSFDLHCEMSAIEKEYTVKCQLAGTFIPVFDLRDTAEESKPSLLALRRSVFHLLYSMAVEEQAMTGGMLPQGEALRLYKDYLLKHCDEIAFLLKKVKDADNIVLEDVKDKLEVLNEECQREQEKLRLPPRQDVEKKPELDEEEKSEVRKRKLEREEKERLEREEEALEPVEDNLTFVKLAPRTFQWRRLVDLSVRNEDPKLFLSKRNCEELHTSLASIQYVASRQFQAMLSFFSSLYDQCLSVYETPRLTLRRGFNGSKIAATNYQHRRVRSGSRLYLVAGSFARPLDYFEPEEQTTLRTGKEKLEILHEGQWQAVELTESAVSDTTQFYLNIDRVVRRHQVTWKTVQHVSFDVFATVLAQKYASWKSILTAFFDGLRSRRPEQISTEECLFLIRLQKFLTLMSYVTLNRLLESVLAKVCPEIHASRSLDSSLTLVVNLLIKHNRLKTMFSKRESKSLVEYCLNLNEIKQTLTYLYSMGVLLIEPLLEELKHLLLAHCQIEFADLLLAREVARQKFVVDPAFESSLKISIEKLERESYIAKNCIQAYRLIRADKPALSESFTSGEETNKLEVIRRLMSRLEMEYEDKCVLRLSYPASPVRVRKGDIKMANLKRDNLNFKTFTLHFDLMLAVAKHYGYTPLSERSYLDMFVPNTYKAKVFERFFLNGQLVKLFINQKQREAQSDFNIRAKSRLMKEAIMEEPVQEAEEVCEVFNRHDMVRCAPAHPLSLVDYSVKLRIALENIRILEIRIMNALKKNSELTQDQCSELLFNKRTIDRLSSSKLVLLHLPTLTFFKHLKTAVDFYCQYPKGSKRPSKKDRHQEVAFYKGSLLFWEGSWREVSYFQKDKIDVNDLFLGNRQIIKKLAKLQRKVLFEFPDSFALVLDILHHLELEQTLTLKMTSKQLLKKGLEKGFKLGRRKKGKDQPDDSEEE